MSQQQQNKTVRAAMAWDPTCPARLCLLLNGAGDAAAKIDSSAATANKNAAVGAAAAAASSISVDYLYADSGYAMSCNAHELAALHAILKAHDEYHANMQLLLQQQQGGGGGGTTMLLPAFQSLSRACRAAVLTCCEGWEQEIVELQEQQAEEDAIQESVENLDLLKTMHAILHLSDIFLPLLPTSSSSSSSSSDYDMVDSDAFERPGVVTADTIRYLRYNHLDYAVALYDPVAMAEMLENSMQPEEYTVELPGGTLVNLYWSYIATLVKRGCLEKVWETLQLHSLYRTAMSALALEQEQQQQDNNNGDNDDVLETDNDEYYLQTMKNVRNGFFILRMVLLRAPLPAGRNDEYDTALLGGTPPEFVEHQDDHEIDPGDYYDDSSSDIDNNTDMDYNHFLQGLDVAPRDYKYWEESMGTAATNATAAAAAGAGMDLPILMSASGTATAMRKHATWQRFVQDLRPHFALSRRIPELDTHVLAILAGDFENAYGMSSSGGSSRSNGVGDSDGNGTGNTVGVPFASWVERLCAELLYKRPNLSPRELHSVTRRTMKQFMGISSSSSGRRRGGDKKNDDNDETERLLMEQSPMAVMILQIMQGRAGQAIENMYLLGGGSGAALPTTLVSV
jgi:hypothetical protein